MLMYTFTQIKKNWDLRCCSSNFKRLKKSITTGLALVMLFLLGSFDASAQINVFDNDISDWVTALDNPAYPAKVFKRDPNATDDSQFTQGSKDVSILPDGWAWTLGQTNNKGDISNAGAIIIGTKLFFFGDR